MVLITSGERPAIPNPEELPGADTATFGGLSAYIALLKRCWAQEPTSRPSFEEIVKELRCGQQHCMREVCVLVGGWGEALHMKVPCVCLSGCSMH